MINVRYKGINDIIDFGAEDIVITNSDMMNYAWITDTTTKIDGSGAYINRLYKEPVEINLEIVIYSDKKLESQINHLVEISEENVLARVPGRLYVNDEYIDCYITKFKTIAFYKNAIKIELVLYAPRPFWQKEVKMMFLPGAGLTSTGHKYAYKYPYAYIREGMNQIVQNEHYTSTYAKIIMYGYVKNPSFTVAGNQYAYNDILEAGDRVEINQQDRSVIKFYKNGQRENCFSKRGKTNSVFKPFPPGNHTLYSTGTYGIDIILFRERSCPEWKSLK